MQNNAQDKVRLSVQSALSCLEEALHALEQAEAWAERQERLGETVACSTEVLSRAANSVRSAQRTLETAKRGNRR